MKPGLHSLEEGRSNTHNREGMVIDVKFLSDRGIPSAKMTLPETIADYHDRRAASFFVVGRNQAAPAKRSKAQNLEIICRSLRCPHPLRLVQASHADRKRAEGSEPGKTLVGGAQVFEIRIRKRKIVQGRAAAESHEGVGIRDTGQRVEQRRVDPTEDGAVGADA